MGTGVGRSRGRHDCLGRTMVIMIAHQTLSNPSHSVGARSPGWTCKSCTHQPTNPTIATVFVVNIAHQTIRYKRKTRQVDKCKAVINA